METDRPKELIKEEGEKEEEIRQEYSRSHNLFLMILLTASVIVVGIAAIFAIWNTLIPSASAMYSVPVKYMVTYQYDNEYIPVQQQDDIEQQQHFGIEQISNSEHNNYREWQPASSHTVIA
jgi:hypothetical protein